MANTIDIFNVEPHKVSKDLKGYAVMFYGEPKSGKTTTATRFPKSLLLAFEKGYSAIPGVRALPINSWSEFKKVLRQLKTDQAKEMYDNIIIDTVDIAYGLCEKFIVNQHGASDIADQKKLPYGKGYQLVEKEFDEQLRSIMAEDYGLVMISHSQDKVFKDESGEEYNQIIPTLDKRGNKIITRMADIIGYSRAVNTEEGLETRLYMRGTPRFVAGSRFDSTPDYIVFNYDNLVGAISDAVSHLEQQFGIDSVTDNSSTVHKYNKIDTPIEELIETFNNLAGELMEANADFYGPRIRTIVNEALGHDNKVADATPEQAELVDLAITNLKDLAASQQ
ncbi:Sak4-like ssDNA annealing protein [Enterococcus phage VRE9_2]